MEDKLQSAAELPYFDGDFWPNVLGLNREPARMLNLSRVSVQERKRRKNAVPEEDPAQAATSAGSLASSS